MKIRELKISNLRGLSNVEFSFDKPTNIIVGPNAIGKTTVLEAVRLVKAILMPRYAQEAQQVLVSLGAMSPHPHLAGYIDTSVLSRDPQQPIEISISFEIDATELAHLKAIPEQVALELIRSQQSRADDQSQIALAQFLSSSPDISWGSSRRRARDRIE